MINYNVLQQTLLFSGITKGELENLFSEFSITETRFKRGDVLARQDEPVNRLIILLTGAAKGEMSDPSGKIVKVDDIAAPNPLAILFLFGAKNRFPVQATATEDGTALVIPKEVVLKMLTRSELLLKNYLDISANFALRLSKKLHLMSFRTIRQKLALYLLELANAAKSNTVRLDKTHVALAEYFGVSRQALERELKNMANDGLLETQGRLIMLREKQQLVGLIKF